MLSVRTIFLSASAFNRIVLRAGLVLLCAGLVACANYHLGTGGKVKFATLFIAPVVSKTVIPQAQALVTTQLREAFIRDGRVALVDSAEAADAVLRISLVGYDQTVSVAQTADTGLARRFDLTLQARATLTDNRQQQTYFAERALSAKRGVFTDSGLVPAEYETLPLLAEQLAKETVHAVLDVW
jgi:hypothetical protein